MSETMTGPIMWAIEFLHRDTWINDGWYQSRTEAIGEARLHMKQTPRFKFRVVSYVRDEKSATPVTKD